MSIKIAARFDATSSLGGGHGLRCLTLLNAFHEAGISRETTLLVNPEASDIINDFNIHQFDQTIIKNDRQIAASARPVDVLIVDHYQLDQQFERAARAWAKCIFVIDDLENRPHDCDFLLDQTLGRTAQIYQTLTPPDCTLLLGPKWCLVRPEFSNLRPRSLAQRQTAKPIQTVMISTGLTDPVNATGLYLNALEKMNFKGQCHIVLGRHAPFYQKVKQSLHSYAYNCTLHENVTHMAELMCNMDFVLGAAGTSSWERCVLGLPSSVLILADNQTDICENLGKSGVAINLGTFAAAHATGIANTLSPYFSNPEKHQQLSQKAAMVCDGRAPLKITQMVNEFFD